MHTRSEAVKTAMAEARSKGFEPPTVTDHTGAVEEAARIARSEDRFSKVFRASPVAIILRTLEDGRVIDVNSRYSELVGFAREELVGHTVWEKSLWVDEAEGERILDELRRKGSLRNVEGRFRRKSGEIRDVLISGELTTIDGETVVIGMVIDITERKRMETELRRSREQLRSLSARLQQIREEERTRISRELHDELGGFLTALKLDLEALGKDQTTTSAGFREKIRSMSVRIVSAIGSVRRICSELRPSVLEDIGLTAAIDGQLQEWEAKTAIRCTMTSMVDESRLDAGRATAAFRVLQEALTNVARHAAATSVTVGLWTDDERLHLQIHDDGRGIAKETVADVRSLGLLGMKERVFHFGGSVDVQGARGEGTTVDVSIPLATGR